MYSSPKHGVREELKQLTMSGVIACARESLSLPALTSRTGSVVADFSARTRLCKSIGRLCGEIVRKQAKKEA